ncbi:MAG: Threonyl/alanyl tRNA synthetase SAD [Candidatus Magasanikbacteria bacterium GW2011_GWC2_37_14]|uniref:Threonyl/alanyl tRNA synthetase SAD n=1 Tax=Candidatus Magasanikbacteria bacterium GW2011_GWC2_37_14 TaxID=1619046 RepID=A0A0G0JFL9_9BACT|nr:MAG: Threonyl/alanyl tRNA synthetase SAD [Candidatus Magasanikbacteria bacterium GW2011_GWC2_37_14]
MSEIDPKQHSAEHILSAVFGQLFNSKIIDSRFRGNNVRCDYELEIKIPTEEIIKEVEDRANIIISENREVVFEEIGLEQAKALYSLHRLPDGVKNVSIVKIGSDIITPCKGPHVKNTKEIGILKIRTHHLVSPNVLRLTFVLD